MYKRLQKEVRFDIKRARQQYMQDIVSESYTSRPKRFWSYVKDQGQDSQGVHPLKNKDGFIQSDSAQKAEILNDQFKSVFTQEDMTNFPSKGNSPFPQMPNIKISQAGVFKLLKNLDTSKATGPDSIPAYVLKTAAEEITPTLTHIFQLSLDSGQVPRDWTMAWVVPIFKKGEKHQAANYRPVSLTSITCKLMEHIVHSSVMQHFDQYNILTDCQHGFRKRRSCESQLIVTIHDIAKTLSEGEQVDMILLDFSKAFDKVPHQRLLHKLSYYGVKGTTLQWISAFLSDRKQQVLLEGVRSTEADVVSGVPQGTVLGPLLFLAYINDMPECATSSTTRLFADDSLLYRKVRGYRDSALLQRDLTALSDWEACWQMEFNPSKCQVLHITPSKHKPVLPTTYQLHGQVLESTDSAKYLGVTISEDLSWSRQAETVAAKASRTVGFLRRNFRDCTPAVRAATYTSMVRPIMEYASSTWDPHHKKDIKVVEKVQRRAARYAFNNYRDREKGTVTTMLSSLQWDSLEQRRQLNRLQLLFKIKEGLVDIRASDYLRQADTRTRGAQRLFQERTSHPAIHNSFFPRTIREWNRLPIATTAAPCLESFKTRLSCFYTQQPVVSTH